MIVKLQNVRLSFPDLFTPRAFQAGGDAKYKATFLIPKADKAQLATVNAAIRSVAETKWGKKADAVLKGIAGNSMRFCFQDGATKEYDGYEDAWAVSAGNKSRPTIIDRDKSPLTQDDGRPYAGCYVNAIIEFFAYDNSGNGISASLKGVQFVRHGEAFGGGSPVSADEFDDLSTEEEDALV
jgi:hypothetical protein